MFFVYIIKVAVLQTVFYLTYKLLLSRESFHAFNRGVLLTMQAAALLLPLLHITLETPAPVHHTIALAEATFVQTATVADGDGAGLTFIQVLTLVWIAGFVLLLVRSVVSLVRLMMLLRSGRLCETCGTLVTVVSGDTAPFSWFNRIVISLKDYLSGAREIVIHEQAHVSHHHSVDIALCNTIIMFCWFSPAAWLLRAELRDVHEYEADDAVLRQGVDASGYQLLLIRKAVGERLFAMANNLNQTNLKKRITMMKMKKSNPWNRVKAAIVLPLAAVSVIVFATPAATKMAGEVALESDKIVSEADAMIVKADAKSENMTSVKVSATGKMAVPADSVKQSVRVGAKSVSDDVLVVIDGRETNMNELNGLDASKINSVTVLKDDSATKIYGDKAKNGVIVVTMKKSAGESSASSASSENKATAGKVNTITIHQKGNPVTVGDVKDMRIVKLSSDGKKPTTVEVYNMEKEPTYMIDGKTVTKEEVEALLPNDIESVVVNKGGTSGENTVNIFLKKKTTGE